MQIFAAKQKNNDFEELNYMKQLTVESLDAGALGLSTGLFYAPGYYARTDEVIALAEEVGKRNKLYSTHQRDEGSRTVGLFVSLNEAIEIGRRAECKVQISHVKCDTFSGLYLEAGKRH